MQKDSVEYENLAEQPQLQIYQKKPVENFGINLLKGMGFDQSKGIGRRNKQKQVQILILKPRPKGLGLGAEVNQEVSKQKLEVGDRIKIKSGTHDGLTGFILEIMDESSVKVEIHPSKSQVKVSLENIQKIHKKQMQKILQEMGQQKEQRKKKRLKWIVPYIKIKIVNKNSLHYLQKLVVTELISEKQFECRDQNGKIHTDILERDAQTVIPKVGELVYILKGDHKGCKARIMDSKKRKGRVTIQTVEELEIIKLDEDDVSQYVQI